MAKKAPEKEPETGAMTEETPLPTPKKKGMSPIIYVVIAVVMIAAGYFGGSKFLGGSSGSGEEHTEKPKEHEPKVTEMVMIDDIIVNPAGTGGTRFLSCSIGFELVSHEAVLQFEKKQPMIRDALITILGAKTLEQLSDSKEKEITRYQIKKRTEQILNSSDLNGVYFTDFVLQ